MTAERAPLIDEQLLSIITSSRPRAGRDRSPAGDRRLAGLVAGIVTFVLVDPLTHLLVAARDGDRDALGELVGRTQPDVWRFCASIVGVDGADDAAQETYLRAWRSARGFREEASAKTWLLAIARRVCWDQAKKRGTQATRLAAAAPILARASVVDHGEHLALEDLVARLQPERRSAFFLTQVLGLSYQEAAEVCDCPVGTIRSRLARARADLIDAVADNDLGEAHPG